MPSAPDVTEAHTEGSVSHRASRAFMWSIGNTVVARLGTLAIGVALARTLGPSEFGIFAIATVTMLAILSFNELGVSLAVIRWRDDPRIIAPTINSVAVASSAVLTAAVIFAAPQVSTMLGDVRATPVVRVMAISILLNGLVSTSAAVLQREFMQKKRTIADQVNTWLGAGLSLGLALLGWGAMSLAVGRLVASVVFGVLLIRWSPIPYRFGWDREVASRLLRFGLPLAGASIIVFAAGYADQVIVGSRAGVQALGFYVLAYNLASWPVSIFSLPLRAVAPATFSALKSDPERMTRGFSRILTILACVALPACLAISGAAESVVGFIYGASWAPAADVLLWLAAFAALRILFELAYDYLVVQGKSGVVMLIQGVSFAVALPLMVWAVGRDGQAGVAATQVVVALVVIAPLYVVALHRIGVRASRIAASLIVPTTAALGVWGVSRALATSVDGAFLGAASAGVFALCVIAALAFWKRDELRMLRAAVRGREST